MSTLTLKGPPKPVAPDRSVQQRADALEEANRIRIRRAALKREIGDSHDLESLLDAPPEWLLTARVYDFLRAIPGWGRTKAQKTMNLNSVSLVKTFGGLTDRQRHALIQSLTTTPSSTRRARWVCRRCGIGLRRPAESGLCGFCQESGLCR
jgi:hypothetical protein